MEAHANCMSKMASQLLKAEEGEERRHEEDVFTVPAV